MAIKLETTPLDRRYWISHNVIYNIENLKKGEGVFINDSETALSQDGCEAIFPKLTVYSYDPNKVNTEEDGFSYDNNSDVTKEVFYLDQFMEDGDMWEIEGNNLKSYQKVNSVSNSYTIEGAFFDGCVEEVKKYIAQQTKKGNIVNVDDMNFKNDTIVPKWVFAENDGTQVVNDLDFYVGNDTINEMRYSPMNMIKESYESLIEDETKMAFNTIKAKYKRPNAEITINFPNE